MKNLAIILVLGFCPTLIGCFSGDDDGMRAIVLEIEDAISIDNKENYSVGDTIFFELNFSRYLHEDGYNTLLDIYESTNSTSFNYTFDLQKFSSFTNDYESIAIDSAYVFAEKGKFFGSYNAVSATLNGQENQYESMIGVILVDTGGFKFNFDYLFIDSGYAQDKVYIDIRHTFTTNVNFEFNVTE